MEQTRVFTAEDADTKVTLFKTGEDSYVLEVRVMQTFIVSWTRARLSIKFTATKLNQFVDCLNNGEKSWHGDRSLWEASQIYIKKLNHPFKFRDVKIYHRVLILGASLIPVTFSAAIMEQLGRVKVEPMEAVNPTV